MTAGTDVPLRDVPLDSILDSRLLIDGALVAASDKAVFESLDPYTEKPVGSAADATDDDFGRAIQAARRVADDTRSGSWGRDPKFRAACLRQLATALRSHQEEIRALIVREVGSPVWLTRDTVLDIAIENLERLAELADDYPYETLLPEVDFRGAVSVRRVWREPYGVVAAFSAYNSPWAMLLNGIGHAAATGNAVVAKPSELTPLAGTVLARLIHDETDFPPGTVNIVTSSVGARGELLSASPDVDFVTFIGSVATGRRVAAAAAAQLKKVLLELGGKSPCVVLPGADAAKQAAAAAISICANAGQGCGLRSRLLLPWDRYDEGVAAAKAAMEGLRTGDPADPATYVGPVASRAHQERIIGAIHQAVDEGARLVTGGGAPAGQPHGYFVDPTLLADVDPSSAIAQEEVFGPVLAVFGYSDAEEALRIANGTIYGLSAAVVGATDDEALEFARRLQVGTCNVNGGFWRSWEAPFGGYKQSGVGRTGGVRGFEAYLETKVVGLRVERPAGSLAWGES